MKHKKKQHKKNEFGGRYSYLSQEIKQAKEILHDDDFYTNGNHGKQYQDLYQCLDKMQEFFYIRLKENYDLWKIASDYLVRLRGTLLEKQENETTQGKSIDYILYANDLLGSQGVAADIKEVLRNQFDILLLLVNNIAFGTKLPQNFKEKFREVCENDPFYKDITIQLNKLLGGKFTNAVWEFHERERPDQELSFGLDAHLSNMKVPLLAKDDYKRLFERKGFSDVIFVPQGKAYKIIIPDVQRQLQEILISNLPSEGIMNTMTYSFSP